VGFVRSDTAVSAIFRTRQDAERAAADLRGAGLSEGRIEVVRLEPGRYVLEDELTPERVAGGRLAMIASVFAGGAIGVTIVGLAVDAPTIAAYLGGFLPGLLLGWVVGGVIMSVFILPDDDDEDVWIDVAEDDDGTMVVAWVDGPHAVRWVRSVLADGAAGFLPRTPPAVLSITRSG
jgi:hypothetical protein